MEQPFILCGLGRVGWRVLEYLRATGHPVVAVDIHCDPKDPRLEKVRLVRGDCRRREVLEEAGVTNARGVLILTSEDLVNISAALAVRSIHPDVRVVIRVFNQNLINRLGKAVHNVYALSTGTLTAPVLALTAQAGQALGAFRVEVLADGKRQVVEVTVSVGSPLLGRTVAQVNSGSQMQVLALFRHGQDDLFLQALDPETPLVAGDRLILCGEPRAIAAILAQSTEEAAPHLLWAGWLRRHGRVAWRTLTEIDWPVQLCTLILLLVVLVSTLAFRYGADNFPNLSQAFYRTISIMATGADMGLTDQDPQWERVYAGILRLLGAALTAAFTALFTNYLLRARLSGALEIRRIPDSGHVIVSGLGHIGFRVVEELAAAGERVVVIELAADNRFVTTVRRLGVAVISGDATVREVLLQAHAPRAKAIVAATSNDLVNLEVALLARDLNPKQRLVVCLSDAQLAQTLRDAANVRLAVSVPTLAAPAFVAALYGDRVLSVMLIKGRLLAVIDLLVHPGDPYLIGQPVRAVAVDYNLLPLTVVTCAGSASSSPHAARLSAGDRLVACVALPDLERLLRRESLPHNCLVEVTSVPLPARPWATQLLRTQRGLSEEAADQELSALPVCLGRGLTRGQAEDLLALLKRERIAAQVRIEDGQL